MKPAAMSSALGSLRSLKVRRVDVRAGAKPWAGARWRAGAAVGAKGAPTALRCSGFGRAAKLSSLTAFVALGQSQRVSSRSARVRAPTEALALQAALGASAQPLARHEQSTGLFVSGLASSPPHRRAPAHPPTAWRGTVGFLLEKFEGWASSPTFEQARACGARQAAGSTPTACQTLSPKPCIRTTDEQAHSRTVANEHNGPKANARFTPHFTQRAVQSLS
jgi:hypothetical protein